MLFNSFHYLVFFPVAFFLHAMTPSAWRWAVLLGLSSVFYMSFRPVYILVMGSLILIDYSAGLWIESAATPHKKKIYLLVSLAANLGLLGFFKYYGFFSENLAFAIGLFGKPTPLPVLDIMLPVGLSFHTFQSLSYTIEVSRGRWRAERHLGRYALYVMFFPQLVAGPIERPYNLLPRLANPLPCDASRVASGLRLILWGYFKKLVVADRMGIIVDHVYNNPAAPHGLLAVVAAVFFVFQLYGDFSGYSDIARGSARALGYELSVNFNAPFFSTDLAEYWRRWHISMYTWFNDYLYTPLAIATRSWGRIAPVLCLIATFFFSGLWHGASWNFVVFGLIHGIGLSALYVFRLARRSTIRIPSLPAWAGWALTMSWTTFAHVFFRAADFGGALAVLKNGLSWTWPALGERSADLQLCLVWIAVLLAVEGGLLRGNGLPARLRDSTMLRWTACNALLLAIVLFSVYENTKPFIYFQF